MPRDRKIDFLLSPVQHVFESRHRGRATRRAFVVETYRNDRTAAVASLTGTG